MSESFTPMVSRDEFLAYLSERAIEIIFPSISIEFAHHDGSSEVEQVEGAYHVPRVGEHIFLTDQDVEPVYLVTKVSWNPDMRWAFVRAKEVVTQAGTADD